MSRAACGSPCSIALRIRVTSFITSKHTQPYSNYQLAKNPRSLPPQCVRRQVSDSCQRRFNFSRQISPVHLRLSRNRKRFPGQAEIPPINDASALPGNSHVFRHAFWMPDSHAFPRTRIPRQRKLTERAGIRGGKPTFVDIDCPCSGAMIAQQSLADPLHRSGASAKRSAPATWPFQVSRRQADPIRAATARPPATRMEPRAGACMRTSVQRTAHRARVAHRMRSWSPR